MDIIIQVKTFIKPISLTVFYPIWQIKVFNPSSNAAKSCVWKNENEQREAGVGPFKKTILKAGSDR